MAAERAVGLGFGPIRPATVLYGLCCEAGSVRQGTEGPKEALSQWILEWVGEPWGGRLVAVLAAKGKIVQETVGVELLATQDPARVLPTAA